MASLTTPTKKDERFELIRPIKTAPVSNDRAAGILPAGGLEEIIQSFSRRGLAGQAPLHRELERSQLPTIGQEIPRLRGQMEARRREELRPLEASGLLQSNALQDILSQIESFVPATPGIPGVPAVSATDPVYEDRLTTQTIPEILCRVIPGINAPLAVEKLFGNLRPFNYLTYDPNLTGEFSTITQAPFGSSAYDQLIDPLQDEGALFPYYDAIVPAIYGDDLALYRGMRGGSSEGPSVTEINPDVFTNWFDLTKQQQKFDPLGGASSLGMAAIDPLVLLKTLQQGFVTPEDVQKHIALLDRYPDSGGYDWLDQLAKARLASWLDIDPQAFFTEVGMPGTPERTIETMIRTLVSPGSPGSPAIPGTPGLPGSGGDINELNRRASSLTGELGSLQDLMNKIKARPGVGAISQPSLIEPLLSPGRPEENFPRFLQGGQVVKPTFK